MDQYGIPENMFGHVPEAFYGLLGRIVMVTALLELRLLDLLTELHQVSQGVHAGKQGTALIDACHTRLDAYRDDFSHDCREVLDRARAALNFRNSVVHSLWPAPRLNDAYGWRPVRGRKRDHPGQPYKSTPVKEDQLVRLIRDCVGITRELDRLRESAPQARLERTRY